MICDGSKKATLRKPTTKIKSDEQKALNNFKYGAFAVLKGVTTETISVDDITDELSNELGYSTRDEYLANGWNDEYDERLLIRWSRVKVNWDVVEKLGVF